MYFYLKPLGGWVLVCQARHYLAMSLYTRLALHECIIYNCWYRLVPSHSDVFRLMLVCCLALIGI
jgi:hypothetical protein